MLTGGNVALAKNSIEGNPVRVSRLVTGKTYRYDGLYRVDEYWCEKGKDGYLIWRLRLVYLDINGFENTVFPQNGEISLAIGNQAPQRTEVTTSRVIRNSQVGSNVKSLHNYTCQICSLRLETPAGPYAECCHIKPLGKPHNGPDVPENVLCLCPNCHVLFDNHALQLTDDLNVVESNKGLRLHPQHKIGINYIKYHRGLSGK